MARILLIHWKRGELPDRVQRLTRLGHDVEGCADPGGQRLRRLRDDPPDAVVIDLSRLPSHGRAVAGFLREQKSTRCVPLVFVGGQEEKAARVRDELPDAVFTTWDRIAADLRRALKHPPTQPVVPRGAEGYSGTPLPRKLGITPERKVALIGAPDGFETQIAAGMAQLQITRKPRERADLVMLFARSLAELKRKLPAAPAG